MPRRRKELPDPEDLLSGVVPARVRDLFDLIHWINPSGTQPSKGGKSKAYETKAALQSLLIEEFSEELEVEPTAGAGDAVVGIKHRYLPLNACHAIVSQLSPRAKLWVISQMDSPDKSELDLEIHAKEKARMRKGLEKLLANGDQALDRFDFPLAADCYEKVLRRSKAWKEDAFFMEAAKRFLVLMVDYWVDDERVLMFLRELPVELACHQELCPLFAVSLERLGMISRPGQQEAIEWIRSQA